MRTLERPHGFEPLSPGIGVIPAELSGRLYHMGPGRFEEAGTPFRHWFDGEGMITAVDFAEGNVYAACRLIQPDGFGTAAYSRRGRFGQAPQGFWRRALSPLKADLYANPANTALMLWRDRLFALYEGGFPTEVDPDTLATMGETNLGAIRRTFSAHPKLHRPSGAIIGQGFSSPLRPQLDYYALEPSGSVRRLFSAPFLGSSLTHDFAVTDRFIVSICSPLFIDAWAILFEGLALSETLRWQPERGTEILITPINGSSSPKRLSCDAFFYSHTANAYEDGEEIVIHCAAAPDASGVDWVSSINADAEMLTPPAPGRLTELRINPASNIVRRSLIAEAAMDYPTIDPRRAGKRHSIIYGTGFCDEEHAYRDLFNAVVKADLARGTVTKTGFGDGHFVSEALFAPRPGSCEEDAGWLLCLNYDATADESYVAILTADGAPATLATIPLGQSLPLSFHGLWVGAGRRTRARQ